MSLSTALIRGTRRDRYSGRLGRLERSDQVERRLRPAAQPLAQSRSGDQPALHPWHVELGPQQWRAMGDLWSRVAHGPGIRALTWQALDRGGMDQQVFLPRSSSLLSARQSSRPIGAVHIPNRPGRIGNSPTPPDF